MPEQIHIKGLGTLSMLVEGDDWVPGFASAGETILFRDGGGQVDFGILSHKRDFIVLAAHLTHNPEETIKERGEAV